MSPERTVLDELRIDRGVARRRESRNWVGGLIVVIVLGAGGASYWWFNRAAAVSVQTVAVREASAGGQRTLLNSSGYVTARREATVSSKVTGKVVEVLIEEGVKVEAGQVLARIDSSNVEASLRLAEAQKASYRASLAETQVRLEEAEREWRRVAQLAQDKIASPADLDAAEAEVQSLKARLDKQAADLAVADREIAVWQQQLEDTIVRAPFAGIVTAKNAQPGEMISPMSAGGGFTRTGICTIVDMSSLEIVVDVNESYINRVVPGQRVQAVLDSYPDWPIPGKVIAIIPTADRQKATVQVRVGFDQLDPRVLPHMGVKVAFQGDSSGTQAAGLTLVLPKSAVQQADGRDVVWVVRDGRAERRAVTVGSSRGDEVILAAGVSAGEKVITASSAQLIEGAEVLEAKP
jgi:RND family efflux transporter MFP subunit